MIFTVVCSFGASCSGAPPPSGTARPVTSAPPSTPLGAAACGADLFSACVCGAVFGGVDDEHPSARITRNLRITRLPHPRGLPANRAAPAADPADIARPAWVHSL